MTIATDANWNTAAASPALGVLCLIELAFAGGTLRLNSWPVDMTVLGYTWTGIGTVCEVGELKESEDGNYQKLTLGLTQVQSAYLALALGAAETYQGRSARIWVALVDGSSLQITGAPLLRFAGYMDQVRIQRDQGSNIGKVLLDCQTGAYDVRGNPAALRMNQPQHSFRKPGETGFKYVNDLIARPQIWLSRAFQTI
ncbi:hypothetical protein [Polaromonas jejuensis]|uniref:Uncharacterized protein n=1 Tax=Polaromonas jejuensis TaxID=457502 RepID=A0ABW0QK77_9BURK|nr:hypothetical protein [Polaromonas jejuensis]